MSWPRFWYSRRHWPYCGQEIDTRTGQVRVLRYARFRTEADAIAWMRAMTHGAPAGATMLYGVRDLRRGPMAQPLRLE